MEPTVLAASRCSSCALIAIPPEPFGCERCGAAADGFEPASFPARGTVTAVAVVHRHVRDTPPTPFVVAEVQLDAGPVIKSLVLGAAAGDVSIGDRLVGMLSGEELAFVPAPTNGTAEPGGVAR